ncbi:WXG100 family type VII secretion target [Streptacidiphilus fuscans]|uniref:WXG100 family type VII secretion target n=1 Tax=Streptacidiphilus fuscans TaxID=2789292 RepID=A0A931B6L3_9ACTN|nr:WXG100 family type VII secretion target [Streptacidiphilus fuscans]MBF9070402.1 WXG100 family type VII secretion target [Streptacidiphilus fuscans]
MADGYGDYQAEQAYLKQQQEEQKQGDAAWQKYLQQNPGGKTGNAGFTTNFEAAKGYDALKAMIHDADPVAMRTAGDHWGSVASELKATAQQLTSSVNTTLEHWSGATAEAFRQSAADLNTSLNNGSQYAANTQTAMYSASDALLSAQRNFPAKPGFWDKVGDAFGGESDVQFHEDALKYGLAKAIQMDGGQLNAMEERHQEAVLLMEQLGQSYNDATAQLVPPTGSRGEPVTVWPPAPTTQPTPPIGTGTTPPAPPNQGGDVAMKPITGGGVHGGTFTPHVNNGDPHQYHVNPILLPPHGGRGGNNWGIGTKLDGVSGGLHSGVGTGGGFGGGGGVGGVGGLGVGGGAGGAGFGGGGMVGMSGLGGSSLSGGAGSGTAAGEAAGVSEEGAMAAEGEGASGASGESGMGAGGLGGLANAAGKKKQRKGRADYLVEDEETWGVDAPVNPGVITF